MKTWRLLILVLTTQLATTVVCANPNTDAGKNQAKISGKEVRSVFGSRKALNEKLVDPLISTKAMTNIDGTTFNTQIGCPTEKKALELLIAPSTTGDITTAIVSQDLDGDGSMETVQALPSHISGACSNGYVSCTAGQWTGCKYYQWDALATGQIQTTQVTSEQLGGCYCVNNHCGANLVMTNLNNILADLTGGMIAKVAQTKNEYSPSKFVASGTVGTYYLRTLDECGKPVAKQTNTTYLKDASTISADAFSATTGTDEAAMAYQDITTSDAATESQTQINSCGISRKITTKYQIVNVPSCTQGTWFTIATGPKTFDTFGDSAWLEAQAYCDPGNPLQLRFRAYDGGVDTKCNTKMGADANGFVTLTVPYPSDTVQNGFVMTHPELKNTFCFDVPVFYDGGCVSSSGGCTFNFTAYDGAVSPYWRLPSSDPNSGNWGPWGGYYPNSCSTLEATYNTQFDTFVTSSNCIDLPTGGAVLYKNKESISLSFTRPHFTPTPDPTTCSLDKEWIDDQCTTFKTNGSCSLIAEQADGVSTVSNYTPTGLSPLPTSRTFTNSVCNLTYTRDWWDKTRDYQCLTSSTYQASIDDAIYRAAVVAQTTDASTGAYKDTTKTGSSWSAPTSQMPIDIDIDAIPACTQLCKTKREVENTDAGGAGVSSDLRVDRKSFEYAYKECDTNLVCPLDPGETVDTSCGCIEEFGEAMATIQAYRLGSMDLICTSGVPQQP